MSGVMYGRGPDGLPVPLKVNTEGEPLVNLDVSPEQAAAGGYALDGKDATNVTPLAGAAGIRGWLSSLWDSFGSKADAAASADTGSFSLVALIKRQLAKMPALGTAIVSACTPVAFARKTSITGFPSVVGIANNNLLDSTGNGAWLDVRDHNNGQLVVVSGATTGSYIIQSAFDASGFGLATLQAQETTVATGAAMINGAITPTNGTRQFALNLAGVNYLRMALTAAPSVGVIQSGIVLSQQSPIRENVNIQQATAANLQTTATVAQLPTAAALADALANPTGSQIGADLMLFNGTTWDRHRNNINTVTGDTGVKTAGFAGATQTNFNARGAFITILMGAVTGTTPTYVPQLQWSPDNGTTWINFGPAMAAITATGQYTFAVYPSNFSQTPGSTPANLALGAAQFVPINAPLPRSWRINNTIGGTTPSFTLTSIQVNYIN